MSTVRRVRPLRGSPERWVVEVEGKGRFLVSRELASQLEPGMALDLPTLERLAGEDLQLRAWQASLRLLNVRLRSQAELVFRLRRRGFPSHVVAATIHALEQRGYINDLEFARAWIAGVMAKRPAGRSRLEAELRAKGVAMEIVAQALNEELAETSEVDLAREIASRRLRAYHRLPPEARLRRLVAFLHRRGFSAETTAIVVKELMRNPDVFRKWS